VSISMRMGSICACFPTVVHGCPLTQCCAPSASSVLAAMAYPASAHAYLPPIVSTSPPRSLCSHARLSPNLRNILPFAARDPTGPAGALPSAAVAGDADVNWGPHLVRHVALARATSCVLVIASSTTQLD
jgi:hypothetical protein